LGVAVVVTLLVVWSVRGAIIESLYTPPPCTCPQLVPSPAVYGPVLDGAVVFLAFFYIALFLVKQYADWAKERRY